MRYLLMDMINDCGAFSPPVSLSWKPLGTLHEKIRLSDTMVVLEDCLSYWGQSIPLSLLSTCAGSAQQNLSAVLLNPEERVAQSWQSPSSSWSWCSWWASCLSTFASAVDQKEEGSSNESKNCSASKFATRVPIVISLFSAFHRLDWWEYNFPSYISGIDRFFWMFTETKSTFQMRLLLVWKGPTQKREECTTRKG